MPEQTAPPPVAPPVPPPTNGSGPSRPVAARPRRPGSRTRISSMRTALIGGVLALTVLVIFMVQNARAVHLSFLGAHLVLPAAVALLLAAIAGALLMAAAGTARITQLRGVIRRSRRGAPSAPAGPASSQRV
jgi:lipopolysaccharide assembly protein A